MTQRKRARSATRSTGPVTALWVAALVSLPSPLLAGNGEGGIADMQISVVHGNERIWPIRRADCEALRFLPGTNTLAPSAAPALANIHQQWLGAPAQRNQIVLAVKPTEPPASVAGRVERLNQALVATGIPQDKVQVLPSTQVARGQRLSCPAIP